MIETVDPRKLMETSVEMAQRSIAMMRDAVTTPTTKAN
jgi:hypothetical protein